MTDDRNYCRHGTYVGRSEPSLLCERCSFTEALADVIANEPDGLAGILSDFPHSGFCQASDGEWCQTGRGKVRRLGLYGNQSIAKLRKAAAK